ncbi:YbdD/YjiX family protein [Azospirillum sp. TSO22-1]|uniref:CstA-like transporter-associated (seleno)protein n=1 Tax=Azospirillum sp. TSO22-1 TaxID=716789 RepID=UPI000D606CF9|nr:YbdD/YjiX family protein [Azospirillum sp. TSO22-1]PWC56048.1 hypothetical protein TSO221_03105 [Azospirillum sp. TSO22-1]
MLHVLRAGWEGLRQITGDDAFERYLERHNRLHRDVPPLSREEFYASELDRKWSGVNRCC